MNADVPWLHRRRQVARAATSIATDHRRSAGDARAALASGGSRRTTVKPEEVAEAVAFVRRGASAVTGQAIAVACGEI